MAPPPPPPPPPAPVSTSPPPGATGRPESKNSNGSRSSPSIAKGALLGQWLKVKVSGSSSGGSGSSSSSSTGTARNEGNNEGNAAAVGDSEDTAGIVREGYQVDLSWMKPSIKLTHLNADSSFSIAFRALSPEHIPGPSFSTSSSPSSSSSTTSSSYSYSASTPTNARKNLEQRPFTILLDPWLFGKSAVFHESFSCQEHTIPPSISHVKELEHGRPDVVVISQDKSDHCHEGSLKGLFEFAEEEEVGEEEAEGEEVVEKSVENSRRGKGRGSGRGRGKTVVYAVPGAESKIKSWSKDWWDAERVPFVGLSAWKKGSTTNPVVRLLPTTSETSLCVPVERIANRAQKDRPVTETATETAKGDDDDEQQKQQQQQQPPQQYIELVSTTADLEIAYLPATWPWEMPSLHCGILLRFTTKYNYKQHYGGLAQDISQLLSKTHSYQTLFTPHGVGPSALLPYLAHTAPANTIPRIDLLLHPFTLTMTPPHLGNSITLGIPNILAMLSDSSGGKGKEEGKISVGTVVSTHDEEKSVTGYVAARIKCTRWSRDEVEGAVNGGGTVNSKGEIVLRDSSSGSSNSSSSGSSKGGESTASGDSNARKSLKVRVWELGNGETREVCHDAE